MTADAKDLADNKPKTPQVAKDVGKTIGIDASEIDTAQLTSKPSPKSIKRSKLPILSGEKHATQLSSPTKKPTAHGSDNDAETTSSSPANRKSSAGNLNGSSKEPKTPEAGSIRSPTDKIKSPITPNVGSSFELQTPPSKNDTPTRTVSASAIKRKRNAHIVKAIPRSKRLKTEQNERLAQKKGDKKEARAKGVPHESSGSDSHLSSEDNKKTGRKAADGKKKTSAVTTPLRKSQRQGVATNANGTGKKPIAKGLQEIHGMFGEDSEDTDE